MSGGHFNYQQDYISDIADKIEDYANGREFECEEDKEYLLNSLEQNIGRWNDERDKEEYEYIKLHGKTKPNEYDFSDGTLNEFRKGIKILRMAKVYADRIDWLLSGDDGEEDFHKLLKEELKQLEIC